MNRLLFFFCCLLFLARASAQSDTLRLGLKEMIDMAQSTAPDVQLARTKFTTGYWQYQSFLANFKPQIDFNGTLPNLTRSISEIILPNGQSAFVNRSQMVSNAGLSLSQQIGLTGATVFASTNLQRIDIFRSSTTDGSQAYLSSPLLVGFSQPLFAFNAFRWDKKIQPLVYEETQKQYSQDMEYTAYRTSELFFDVLIAQLNVNAALFDKNNADTLYEISKGRFEVGRIAETELLQIELSVMNARAALAQASLTLQTNTERLRNFLGIKTSVRFNLNPPTEIPGFDIDPVKALEEARRNSAKTLEFRRRLLEADKNVAQASVNSRFSANLFGTVGLTQTGPSIGDAYRSPLNQEQVSLGLSVPIADWGKARAQREIARSKRELERLKVEQEQITFDRDLLLRVQQFDLLRNQVGLANKAYEASRKRQDLTRKRYLIGKIGITDLNIAVQEQDAARRSYISALREFWLAYYEIRNITLYDFENSRSLVRTTSGVEQ